MTAVFLKEAKVDKSKGPDGLVSLLKKQETKKSKAHRKKATQSVVNELARELDSLVKKELKQISSDLTSLKLSRSSRGVSLKEDKTAERIRGMVPRILGTQEPTLWLTTGLTDLVSSGAGAIAWVVACDASGIVDWSDFVAIFDEIKIHEVEICVCNSYIGSTTGVPVVACVVDYDNATAIASANVALAYDTKKIMYLGTNISKTQKNLAQYQGMPDKEWQDTSSLSTLAWFKFFLLGGAPGVSVTYAFCYLRFKVTFRQVN